MVPKEACDVIRARAEACMTAASTSASDLANAMALIDTAVRAIRQAEPVMTRFLNRPWAPEDSAELRATWSSIMPIFGTALELMDAHEDRIAAARVALEKVTER